MSNDPTSAIVADPNSTRPAYPFGDSTRSHWRKSRSCGALKEWQARMERPINSYVVNGNTRWVLGIRTNSTTTVQVLAKAETLTAADQVTIATITIGAKIKVLVDTSQTPPTVLSVQ